MSIPVVIALSAALIGSTLPATPQKPSPLPIAESRRSRAESKPATSGDPAGWIPLSLHRGSFIFARGRLNGVECDILVDSGSITLVDTTYAGEIGLASAERITVRGVGGVQDATRLSGARVAVGSHSLDLASVVGTDLGGVARRIGHTIDLVLGRDVFEKHIFDIDYPKSRLALRDAGEFHYNGPGATVDMWRGEGGRRLVAVSIEGLEPAMCEIDTGNGNALDLLGHYWRRHGLLQGRPMSAQHGGGVGGRLVARVATLRTVRIDRYELREVPANFIDADNQGSFDTEAMDGSIGSGILTRFRWIIDYSRDVAHIEPTTGWDVQVCRKDRIGIGGVVDGGSVRVVTVAANSPAAKAGWKVGDRISAIDGRPVSDGVWRTAVVDWMVLPPGGKLRLTDGQGRMHELVAADYY